MINPSIFRAYDIRGIVNETLTEQTVYLLGQALGSTALEKGDKRIAVGRDGRLSGPLLSKALSDGILSTGCDVIDIGIVPTPLLYYTTFILESRSGVMLTGSHNPPEYNGLKMMINGETLAEIRATVPRVVQRADQLEVEQPGFEVNVSGEWFHAVFSLCGPGPRKEIHNLFLASTKKKRTFYNSSIPAGTGTGQ